MEPRGKRNRKVFELTSSNYLQLFLIKKEQQKRKRPDPVNIMHMLA